MGAGVRPGLVTAGVLLAVLAAGMLLVVNLAPSSSQNRDWFTLPAQPIPTNSTSVALIQGTDSGRGTFTLHWSATAPARVALYSAVGCATASLACISAPPLASWGGNASGDWAASGDLRFPLLLAWSSPTGAPGEFSASAVEASPGPSPLPSLGVVLIDGGAAVLAVLGGVAIFLGLFLRGGVYRGPAPLVSRSADDAEEVAGLPRLPP